MNNLFYKILRPDAQAPRKGRPDDSGFDLFAWVEGKELTLQPGQIAAIATGIGIELPPGYEAQIRPRSSTLLRHGLTVAFGTIDNGYRGELAFVVQNVRGEPTVVRHGERYGQLVPVRLDTFRALEVELLSGTDRGTRGFGSTGV